MNYLTYTGPFQLSEILDSKYWRIQNQHLAFSHLDLQKEFKANALVVSELFEEKPVKPFLNFTKPANSDA